MFLRPFFRLFAWLVSICRVLHCSRNITPQKPNKQQKQRWHRANQISAQTSSLICDPQTDHTFFSDACGTAPTCLNLKVLSFIRVHKPSIQRMPKFAQDSFRSFRVLTCVHVCDLEMETKTGPGNKTNDTILKKSCPQGVTDGAYCSVKWLFWVCLHWNYQVSDLKISSFVTGDTWSS